LQRIINILGRRSSAPPFYGFSHYEKVLCC
jgi:hypothetical protein